MSKASENLRYLRKSHKETQEELANAIGVTKSAVSMYERGEREIDSDKLQLIAAHYGLTVDSLMYSDYSYSNYETAPLTWDIIAEYYELIFPIMVTQKALNNPDFAKGYRIIHNVIERIKHKQVHSVLKSIMYEAMDCFISSMSDKDAISESEANLIWLLLVVYTMIPDEYSKSIGEALLQGKGKQADFIKKYTLKDSIMIRKENCSKFEYAKTHHDTMSLLISELKKSDKYSDLADYYIALRYIVGLVSNDYSDDFNRTMGIEMMHIYAVQNNKYASEFLERIENL